MVELNKLRTMKGFPHRFFWFKIWFPIIYFILPKVCLVYSNDCHSLDDFLSIDIPDKKQNANTIIQDLTNTSDVKLSINIMDPFMNDSLKLVKNESTSSWQLRLVKNLSLDSTRYPEKFQLECQDSKGTIKKSIFINYIYLNTYPPVFKNNSYKMELHESTSVNTIVFSVSDKFNDEDFWPNTKSIYEYLLDPKVPEFDIGLNNGNIILRKPLDYDNDQRKYTFTVFVQDLGDNLPKNKGKKVNTTLELMVLNDDDLSPKFIQRFFHVKIFGNDTRDSTHKIEPTPKAIDGDNLTQEIAYNLIDKPKDFDENFEFLPKVMAIKLKRLLNKIPRSTFEVTIKAYQVDRPTDRYDIGYLVINVFGINTNSPIMTKTLYEASVREKALPSTLLLLVKATDKEGNELEYRMSPKIEEISLNNTNGLVTLSKPIDSTNETIKFQVWAQESSTIQSFTSAKSNVIINVIDENDHSPVFLQTLYNFTINQSASPYTHVGSVNATDKDPGTNGEIIYHLVGNPNLFSIDSDGIIKTTESLVPKVDKYRFMVTAKDKASENSRSTSVFVEVNIKKENIFTPKFPKYMTSKISILESTPKETIVLDIFATDDDLDELTYTVNPSDAFGIKSSINSSCNFLYLKKELDAETTISYDLQITASDMIHNTTHSLKVTVRGVNDIYPSFVKSKYTFRLPEDKPPNFQIGNVLATDGDVNPSQSIIYTLPGNSDFKIDSSNGKITTQRKFSVLKEREFTFAVFASDNGIPNALNASCLVKIIIEDVDNYVPEFGLPTVQLIVPEENIKDRIYRLNATDKDLDPKFRIILYEIINSSSSMFFKLENECDLYLKSGNENKVLGKTISVIVETFNKDQNDKKNSINITITFKDINNKVPRLQKSQYGIDIFENSTVGWPILKIQAFDDDIVEENKLTEFSIVDWSQENPFFINANTGVISPWRTLDADGTQNKSFSFKIKAQNLRKMDRPDNGRLFTEARVNINVINVNDNPPKFIQNIYLFPVNETAPLNQTLFQISALDLDNDEIIYSLAGNFAPFSVDPSTGNIALSQDLDYEKKSMYNFSILAYDNTQLQKSATADVVILVKNMNNKSPTVPDNMTFSVREEQPKGTLIGYIYATDLDGDDLIYSTDSKNFSVNSSTGELRGQIVFDYENQKQYEIVVQVSDKLHIMNVTVTINIIDINDNDPQFSQKEYKTNLTNFKKDSPVITLLATDNDKNDKISYSLKGDADFDIQGNGKIFLVKKLDWTSKENFITLMASATDLKNSSTSVIVSILLVKPMDFVQNNFTASISEAAPIGTTIFQFEPCDFVDRTVNVHSLAIDLSNKSLVDYDEKCGCIHTKVMFDREKVEVFEITMKLKDQYGNHQANLQIHIEDVNDEPPILDQVNGVIKLRDDSDPGLFIIKMNATDKDQNNGFTYLLKETYGKFMIDKNNGVIKSYGRFNYRLEPEYNLTVIVIDHGSPPCESNQTFTIEITNGNRYQPVFKNSPFIFQVNESASAGYWIGQVSATDDDQGANGNLTYDIIGGNKNYAFAIEKNGTVRVNNSKALDYEMTKIFNLTVKVSDCGTNPKSSRTTLLIFLEDINDNFPEFKSADFVSVHLEIPEKGLVFTVYAMDADSSKNGYNKIRYSQLNLNNIFVTDPLTGEVRTKSKLTNVKMYTMNFQACDAGGNCANQTVSLSTYTNTPNVVQVDEGVQNAFVTDVNATDGDLNVFYSLISCNEYFTINSTSGIIQTRVPLVWHPQNNNIPITVVVHYSNNENNATKLKINVHVVDVNDHVPEFSQKTYSFQIAENTKNTFHIKATDMDDKENALITYDFFPSKPQVAEGSILLNPKTGTLTVSSLDREEQALYKFNIMAIDKGHPPKNSTTEVIITLLDINDNAPVFKKDEYEANVHENSEPQKILTVHADDMDSDLNGTIYYELPYKSVPFSINQITGDIWLMGGLDYEKNSIYKLQVMAFDQGINPKNSSCSVSIYVLDVCDEVPQLTTIISFSKDRNIIGTPVFSLKSSDNGTHYNISTEDNIVAINEETGNVITNSEISKTDTNYPMTVTAWNHCDLPVLTKFEIKPEDPLPKSSIKNLKAEITENHCSKQSLFNLSSIQEFQGHDISFKLKTFTDIFKIENEQLYCKVPVDREKNSKFELLIHVTFKNSPLAYISDETLKIVVTVNDINDHYPRFKFPSLFYSIPSTAQFFHRVEKVKVIDEDVGENGASQFSLIGGDKDLFYINPSSGELHILFNAENSEKSEFNMQVMAVDQNGKGLAAKAPLKVSIYDNQFNLEMAVDKPVDFVEKILDSFIGNLSKILGFEIVVDQVQVHQNLNKHYDLHRSAILFHALNLKSKKLVSKEIINRQINAKKAAIDDLLNQFGMQASQVQHAFVNKIKKRHKISNSEIIIIVLACIIFIGCVLGIIITIIMTKRQRNKINSLKSSMKNTDHFLELVNPAFESPKIYNSREISEDSPSTNRHNGDLPNQSHAKDNHSFHDDPKDHKTITCSTIDGHTTLSNINCEHVENNEPSSFSLTDEEASKIDVLKYDNSEQVVPAPPSTIDSPIAKLDSPVDINSASDTSDCLPESSIVLDSGVANKNQDSDLDADDVIVQTDNNALYVDQGKHPMNENPVENGDILVFDGINDDYITEL